ncbi:MAG: DUF3276 family protein [Bacteroidota bacterium]
MGYGHNSKGYNGNGFHSNDRDRDEVYSQRVPAGKRTYFFDVKTTRSGEDYFITITESKRVGERRYEKHKIFLYKEDFGKFAAALFDAIGHVKEELLPGYEFRGLPEVVHTEEPVTHEDAL